MSTVTFSCWSPLWSWLVILSVAELNVLEPSYSILFSVHLIYSAFLSQSACFHLLQHSGLWAIPLSLWNPKYIVGLFTARHRLLIPPACFLKRAHLSTGTCYEPLVAVLSQRQCKSLLWYPVPCLFFIYRLVIDFSSGFGLHPSVNLA